MTWTGPSPIVARLCNSLRRKPRVHDPEAPYDGYDESEDTEEKARSGRLKKQH